MRKVAFLLVCLCSVACFGQTSGSIPTTGGGTGCVTLGLGPKVSLVVMQITGTWTGTLQAQISVQGQAPTNISVVSSSNVSQSTITANGVYSASVPGANLFQLCGNTVGSGTANVFLNLSNAGSVASLGGSTTGGGGTASANYYYLSQNCFGQTNCTQIYADGKVINDGTSNSTTTVTCTNSDCNFTQADVGKIFWATNAGTDAANNTTFVCPQTTIASVTNSTTAVLNSACTANATANGVFIWGHSDGATLHALDGNNSPCVDFIPPPGATILFDQAEFIVQPTTACGNPGEFAAIGYPARSFGPMPPSTLFIMTPNFQWSTCTGNTTVSGAVVCWGSGLSQLNNTEFWGTGLVAASNTNCSNASGHTFISLENAGGSMQGVNVNGICAGTTFTGVILNSQDEYWYGGGAQWVGNRPCVSDASGTLTELLDCREDDISGVYGFTVLGGSNTDIASWPIIGLDIKSGATISTRGTHFGAINNICAVQQEAGGTWFSYGDFVGADNGLGVGGNLFPQVCLNGPTGSVQMMNTVIQQNQTGGTAYTLQFNGGSKFVSLGGNSIPSVGAGFNFANTTAGDITGMDVLQGACTGTVTSASTIGLYVLGNNTTTTCTSTTTNLGPTMGRAGTVVGFQCRASTAGNQTADACTVMQNNVASSMTCSLNGKTWCGDGTHAFTYAAGDIITVKVVSGTSTTLAGVKASVMTW